jgi:hypothetical protein
MNLRDKITLPGTGLVSVLKQAGFSGPSLRIAYAVARAESGGRPDAFNGNAKSGDESYGLFQINMRGRLGPARRGQYGLSSNSDLFDPLTSARIAYDMSGGGKDWSDWGAFLDGHYRRFLSEFDNLQ